MKSDPLMSCLLDLLRNSLNAHPAFAREASTTVSFLFRWYQRSNGEIYFEEQYGRLEKHFVSAAYWRSLKRKPPLSPAPD